MFKFYIISVFVILFNRCLHIKATGSQALPEPSYTWDDENVKKIIREIDLLKASIETLKVRTEMQQSLFEQHLMKMDLLINKSSKPDMCVLPENPIQETPKKRYPSNCAEAMVNTHKSGIYSIKVDNYSPQPFLVYCDGKTQGGDWLVIQRREDGSVNFLRKWADYKQGFGNLNGEFFIGLDKLHALTTDTPQELLIVMQDYENATKYAKYDAFAIGDENEGYALNVLGAYSGDAGDSLKNQATQKFTTIDRDNDSSGASNCAVDYHGAWWYAACHASNLNGLYLKGEYPKDKYAQGVVWHSWKGHYYSLKHVVMLIRSKKS